MKLAGPPSRFTALTLGVPSLYTTHSTILESVDEGIYEHYGTDGLLEIGKFV